MLEKLFVVTLLCGALMCRARVCATLFWSVNSVVACVPRLVGGAPRRPSLASRSRRPATSSAKRGLLRHHDFFPFPTFPELAELTLRGSVGAGLLTRRCEQLLRPVEQPRRS